MRAFADVKAEFERVAAMRHFELELHACGDGSAELAMPAHPHFLQLGGVIHGGAISTLADTAAVYSIHPDLADGEAMTSIEFKLNFLTPAAGGGAPLVATATLVRRGRRVAVSEVEVRQGEAAVAKGLFTYLIFRDDR